MGADVHLIGAIAVAHSKETQEHACSHQGRDATQGDQGQVLATNPLVAAHHPQESEDRGGSTQGTMARIGDQHVDPVAQAACAKGKVLPRRTVFLS